jgi:hypothetical protein
MPNPDRALPEYSGRGGQWSTGIAEVVRGILVTDRERHLNVIRVPRFEFEGTPAIVLVDAQNRVVASWLGWLSPKLEENVIDATEELARR